MCPLLLLLLLCLCLLLASLPFSSACTVIAIYGGSFQMLGGAALDNTSSTAWFSLQYQNAVARVNLTSGQTMAVIPGVEYPSNVVVDRHNTLVVANSGSNVASGIVLLDGASGRLLRTYPQGFQNPVGLALDSQLNVWVTDYQFGYPETGRALKFSATWQPLAVVGNLSLPVAIACDASDNAYVVTQLSQPAQLLVKLSPNGTQLASIPLPSLSYAVAVDSQYRLYSASVNPDGSSSVVQMSPSGVVLGYYNAQLHAPTQMFFDSRGQLWVADGANGTVVVLTGPPSPNSSVSCDVRFQQPFAPLPSQSSAHPTTGGALVQLLALPVVVALLLQLLTSLALAW